MFFKAEDFDTQQGSHPDHKSNLISPELAAEIANTKHDEAVGEAAKIIRRSTKYYQACSNFENGAVECFCYSCESQKWLKKYGGEI